MAKRSIDLVMLNAYVDGELDAEESARIHDLAEHDPDVSRQLGTLTKLKAATAKAPLPRTAASPPRRSHSGKAVVMAASLAFLFLSVATAGYLFSSQDDRARDTFGFARAAHASWADKNSSKTSKASKSESISYIKSEYN